MITIRVGTEGVGGCVGGGGGEGGLGFVGLSLPHVASSNMTHKKTIGEMNRDIGTLEGFCSKGETTGLSVKRMR